MILPLIILYVVTLVYLAISRKLIDGAPANGKQHQKKDIDN
jgi:hypothetical protein